MIMYPWEKGYGKSILKKPAKHSFPLNKGERGSTMEKEMREEKSSYWKKVRKWMKKPWPYWLGGILLAVLNVVLLALTGTSWRITSGFLYWGAALLEKLGLQPQEWYYFSVYNHGLEPGESLFNNDISILTLGIILGALLAVLLSSEFKFKPLKSKKQGLVALFAGIAMGYSSRISFGCNIGAFFSAIPSFSLHGWVFFFSLFIGAWIGSKLLVKYML